MILAEFVEVLQIQCIIKNLIHVRFVYTGFADLEFETEHDPLVQQNHIDSLSETRNIILKNDATVFIVQTRQRFLHDGKLVIDGCFGKPNPLSDSLRNRLIQNGVPQQELKIFTKEETSL